MTISIETACQQALSSFDFAKAAKVYQARGWAWARVGVPNEAHILETAEVLCASLCDIEGDRPCSVSSGGLVVSLGPDEGEWSVSLELAAVTGCSDTYTPLPRLRPTSTNESG